MPLVLCMALLAVGLMAAAIPSNTQSAADVSPTRFLALKSADKTDSTEAASQELAFIQQQLDHAHQLSTAAHEISVAAVESLDSALARQPSNGRDITCTVYMTKAWDYRVGGCPLAEDGQVTHVCVAEKTGRAWKTYYFKGTARRQELKPHAGLCFSKGIADEICRKAPTLEAAQFFGISIGDAIITGTYDLSGMHCYVDPDAIKDMIKAMNKATTVYKGDL
ncbi:unnamed protein product [Vitrella brassicaformis CCMP3155]|uniref:Uncharacterized protein n=2 Tax=Vitrella brassicaformis TaxID=1169539 RepID=A0A0G4FGT4_VITBC|nr:unnamed protein product [Vitrella brassicaformis CCMP3155]|mmetsp:Transcript_8389/g.20504  ORF Transcript_8389/g.20504 Transcript_8389/m.20504 type:complete len:222 (+) Transcript_8389:82-747(+)|eukprot:CEM12054.1 unnamed protein product [Vitrella brassicaformis CCMP3155]